MSQAQTSIDPNAAEGNTETAIATALTAARGKSKPATKTSAPAQRQAPQPTRQAITLELVKRLAPHDALAANLSRTFAIDDVDYHAIRENTEEHVVRLANELRDNLTDKALAIHLQRIVDAFVRSAHGAASFFGEKVSQARALTSANANNDRDEDREGVYGFETKAARARHFAAEMGLQAYALTAAAEGAVYAYAHITGDEWKAYTPQTASNQSVARKSANEELAAFG
jgi:hypothetical protein